MERIIAFLMVIISQLGLPVPHGKPVVDVGMYFEMPDGMNRITYAGLPDYTGLTLVLTDYEEGGFTKKFLIPDEGNLFEYTFSDAEGSGTLVVDMSELGLRTWTSYETKETVYYAFIINSLGKMNITAEQFNSMAEGQPETVSINQKGDAEGFIFRAANYGWYSFNITDDTTGHPYIQVYNPTESTTKFLDLTYSYTHSVAVWLHAMDTVVVTATSVGGYYTGSYKLTAAPAVLKLSDETLQTHYRGIVPWSEILGETTFAPGQLRVVRDDGGSTPLINNGWFASERGDFTVTIMAPRVDILEDPVTDTFEVKVEYDTKQWLSVIFLFGWLWLPLTDFSV